MELEQLAKRIEWLDGERRKDKNAVAHFAERILSLERKLSAADKQNIDLSEKITDLKTSVGRMDQFDEALVQQRAEFHRQIKDQEKQIVQRDDEIAKVLRAEIRTFDSVFADIRKELEPISGLKRDMQARLLEENRLGRVIGELSKNLDDIQISEEEQNRVYRLIEDSRRQDTRRLTELQGEVAALRKRSDDYRGRIDISDIAVRKLQTRLNELLTAERERSDTQAVFMEKQSLAAVEREAIWKEWQTRFETIEKQSVDVESQLQSLDTTYRAIKRTQDAVDDLMQRVERRINEIAEIQRLAEERFRQEWSTFKADDQKRWTNYTLSQDEQRGDIGRRFDRIAERITYVEDGLQEAQDLLNHVNELNANHLQTVLTSFHEWVTSYERTRSAAR
ncbi:MAG: hypothetical protein KKD28_02300 [Chloroflexi bacterium]|nr:hypothetical protein [Chloroflexota bacterium]MBU1660287.1 hypothetical protein [Chloroflexota bacterium]